MIQQFPLITANPISRRKLLQLGMFATMALFCSCKKKKLELKPELLDLGEIDGLLFEKQHIAEKSVLLFRDERGWSCLSTRCSKDGCDLTYQDQDLFCSCCYSRYSHRGQVLEQPAVKPLLWFEISYSGGHLFANSGAVVNESYRFTTLEIEEVLKQLRVKFTKEGNTSGVKIPDILLGQGDEVDGSDFDESEGLPDETISDMTDTK